MRSGNWLARSPRSNCAARSRNGLVTDRDVASVNSSASSTPKPPTFIRMPTHPAVNSRTAAIQRLQSHQLEAGTQPRILHRQHQERLALATDFAFRERLRASGAQIAFQARPRWRAEQVDCRIRPSRNRTVSPPK